ncbi:sla2 Src-like adaptor 2 [Allomyces javanicus]|nr:sla2 Src-like adaptor 2 [Allomyces javanicus]
MYAGSSARSGYSDGPQYTMSRAINHAKADHELLMAIKKATSPEETSPKQKHVRTCIMYTWDNKTSQPFWVGLKNSPMLANEVQCFKALITIHKVIRQGAPVTLPEAISEIPWLQNLPRMLLSGYGSYTGLIRGYIEFLVYKLDFHRIHPDFTGTFDYEEYAALKGTSDPNEGYETIMELMNLQDRLDHFQRMVMASLRASPAVECRLSSLVPLIEESYGIYRFVTSMLRAMHNRVGSLDALAPLRSRYATQHFMLRDFYAHCRQHRYLTSLIAIPTLADQPPPLFDTDEPALPAIPARPVTPPEDNDKDDQADLWEQFNLQQQQQQQQQEELERQRQLDEQDRLAREEQDRLARERAALEEQQFAAQQLAAQQMQLQGALSERDARLAQLIEQLQRAKAQYERDQVAIQQYDAKLRELQGMLANAAPSDALRKLQEELAQWKAKYEALAKLYAQLRKEHLDLLTKYRELGARTQAQVANADTLGKLQAQLNAKNLQLAEMLAARDEYKKQAEMAKMDMQELQDLRRQADAARRELENYKRDKEEEIAVLQTGMDQSLLALTEMKKRLEEGTGSGAVQIAEMERAHAARLDRILDAILLACVQKVQQAAQELESSVHAGNVTATPEYTLSVLDQASQTSGELAQGFLTYLVGGDQSGAITSANAFAYVVGSLLNNVKGVVTRLTGTNVEADDAAAEELVLVGKQAAAAVVQWFTGLTSSALEPVDPALRPTKVNQLHAAVQAQLQRLGTVMEKHSGAAAALVQQGAAQGDLGDLVEREMQAAAQAIADATARLQALLSTPVLDAAPATLQVHSAILSAAMALMNAIANLIRCATLTQQEIAAHGKQSTGGSEAAFYKKHHRWTEGLISAAKAIAYATSVLVETADGVVQGSHSMEQLVVAANEVAAATAQLVAASRVKAVQGSKTQDKLEAAASAVTTATRLLVKAAKDAARREQENKDLRDFGQLSLHDLKTQEMEQQVKILTLEKELVAARSVLAQMRKASYHNVE